MSVFTYRKSSGGDYTVSAEGTCLGVVRRYKQCYNLRRPTTVRGWIGYSPDSKRTPPHYNGCHTTRDAAAEGLLNLLATP